MKIPSPLAGVAGEYFVAAELCRRGYIASISLRNTRSTDILATNAEASRSITIQCKTSQAARRVWVLNEKSEDFVSATHFYVFVALGGVSERPTYHIVPSGDVAKHTRESHLQWLQTPGRGGRKHVAILFAISRTEMALIWRDGICLDYDDVAQPCAAANPAIASRLQFNARVDRVAELGVNSELHKEGVTLVTNGSCRTAQ